MKRPCSDILSSGRCNQIFHDEIIIMRHFILSLSFLISLYACHSGGKENRSEKTRLSFTADTGWRNLSGSDFVKGWHSYGKPAAGKTWDADSGYIHLKPGKKNGYQTLNGGDLVTDSIYSNFHLKLEWKAGYMANSGILLYVLEDTSRYKETWNTGIEMQVCDNDNNEDAHSHKHEAGDLYDLISASTRAAKPFGKWNKVEIISNEGKLDLKLNGADIISTTLWDDKWKQLIAGSKFRNMPGFGTFRAGHIGLQDHGEEVWYRNIMIKKL